MPLMLTLAILASGADRGADGGSAIERAGALVEQLRSRDAARRAAMREQVETVTDELARLKSDEAVAALARFYEFPEVDAATTAALVSTGTGGARDAIAAVLGRDEPRRPPAGVVDRCRRAAILERCADLREGLSRDVIARVLEGDRHRDGAWGAFALMTSSGTVGDVDAILGAVESGRGSGVGSIHRRDREDALVAFLAGVLARAPSDAAAELELRLAALASDTSRTDVVRGAAIRTLGRRGRRELLDVARRVLEKESGRLDLVVATARACVDLGDRSVGPLLAPVIATLAESVASTPAIAGDLITLLDAVYPLRISAAERVVLELSRCRDEAIRAAAVAALPVLGEKRAIPMLSRYLRQEKSWRLRHAAIEACVRMRTRPAIDLLVDRLPGQRGRLRHELLMALHELTGVRMPYVASDWRDWWEMTRDTWKPPAERTAPRSDRETVVLFPDDPATYFGLRVLSRRICLVGDVSGSMIRPMEYDGVVLPRIEVMKAEVARLLKGLGRQAFFNVVFFSNEHEPLFEQLRPLGRPSLALARRYLTRAEAFGGTNLYDALASALEDPHVDTIYLLSDGKPTRGRHVHSGDIIGSVGRINRLRRIQINTIAIGADSDLLRRLAEENGGVYRFVRDEPGGEE